MKSFALNFILVFLLIIFSGCSQGTNPLVSNDPMGNTQNETNSLPVIAFDGSSAIGMMGDYTLSISSDGMSADLFPVRTSSLGESYIVSGKAFFTMTPCTDCLKVSNVALDTNGNIVLGLKIKHPFLKGDVFKPPSGRNRLDLDVFDVALVVAPQEADPMTYPLTGTSAYTGFIMNSDGYTTELGNVTGDNNAMPYKICYENSNYNRFEMGTDYQTFELVVKPGIRLNFNLFLTMGYGASAFKAQRLIPTYYVPEFNRKAAWKVVVTPPQGNDPPASGNTWNNTDTATQYPVTIDIYDWNHGVEVDPNYPDPTATDKLKSESNVSSVTVEIPGMTSAITSASTTDTTTNGWDDPLTYTAMIANENALAAGEYTGLVKVTDTRNPGTVIAGGETDTLVNTDDGIYLTWHEVSEFATYQAFTATVISGGAEPTCGIHADLTEVTVGNIVTVDPGTSADPDGRIVMYEYDFDYDGVTFDTDVSQTEMAPNFGTPVPILMCHSMPTAQIITVALRVTDDDGQSVICTVEITVNPSPKNVALRAGHTAKDFGVREETGEGYVGFEDGQVWIYEPDYSSGAFYYQLQWAGTNHGTKYLDVTTRGDLYAVEDAMGIVCFLKYDQSYTFNIPLGNHETRDVAEVDFYFPGYFNWQNGGYCMSLDDGYSGDPTIRNLYGRHTWEQQGALTWFPPHNIPEQAEGKVSFYILMGIEGGRDIDYLWCLEGAPRFEVERMNGAGTYTGLTIGLDGGQADDISGFNDPKDITTDQNDNVYVLDKTSAGQPVIKKYRSDGTPVGVFGDSSSISGDPLRIDSDNGDGEIHVLHTNGMSVFTICEIPE